MYIEKFSNPMDSKRKYYFTAILYLIAAIAQGPWIYILYQNFEQVERWLTLPVIGWIMIFIFICMVASVPVLIYAGAQLFVLIKKAIMMVTTISQRKKQKSVNQILIAGILLDLLCSYMIIQTNHPDKSLVVFSIAFFGSRILLANLMAISFYFDVEKNKEKGLAKT